MRWPCSLGQTSTRSFLHTATQEYVVPKSMPMQGPTIFLRSSLFASVLSPPPPRSAVAAAVATATLAKCVGTEEDLVVAVVTVVPVPRLPPNHDASPLCDCESRVRVARTNCCTVKGTMMVTSRSVVVPDGDGGTVIRNESSDQFAFLPRNVRKVSSSTWRFDRFPLINAKTAKTVVSWILRFPLC